MERTPFDIAGYVERTQSGSCFICALLRGEPGYAHHIVHETNDAVVFLNKFPTLWGSCLVAPKAHVEDLAGGQDADAFLSLLALVLRVARAQKRVLSVERTYVLSLGSRQGNSHLHWHVSPLPPGVPIEAQQYHALMAEHGVIEAPAGAMAALATQFSEAMAAG